MILFCHKCLADSSISATFEKHLQISPKFACKWVSSLMNLMCTDIVLISINVFKPLCLAAPAKKQPAQSSGNSLFGGGNEEVIGQRARNRKPPGGESHNIFG